ALGNAFRVPQEVSIQHPDTSQKNLQTLHITNGPQYPAKQDSIRTRQHSNDLRLVLFEEALHGEFLRCEFSTNPSSPDSHKASRSGEGCAVERRSPLRRDSPFDCGFAAL